jgi:hypothetical protein
MRSFHEWCIDNEIDIDELGEELQHAEVGKWLTNIMMNDISVYALAHEYARRTADVALNEVLGTDVDEEDPRYYNYYLAASRWFEGASNAFVAYHTIDDDIEPFEPSGDSGLRD